MTILRLLLFLLLVGLVLLGSSYRMASADPIVRETRVALAGWPAGAPRVRALLISDLHVAGPDMPPGRLRRIDEGGRTLVVGAGPGTSILPLRLGARPDLWLVTLGSELPLAQPVRRP
jgi:predicted MPP superfamily phosphohydrolase